MIQSTFDTRASLLLRIRENPSDQSAWHSFVDRYGPLIHAWCRHCKLQAADAEDVTQIILLKIARTLPEFTYDPSRSFRGWLRTITMQAWSDFIGSQRRMALPAKTARVTEMLNSMQARDDLFRRLQEEFDQEMMEQAMATVRERVETHTWEAFRLTAVSGMRASEVAARLGMPVASVYRARSVIQGMLRETIAAAHLEERVGS